MTSRLWGRAALGALAFVVARVLRALRAPVE